MFCIRAVVIDSYMSKLVPELYESSDSEFNKHWLEPVIRIFGSTPDGYKSCVHVHGVFPYIFVPYIGGENPSRDALVLGAALDEALKMAFNQPKSKFVYKVIVISGIPLYGYHSSHRQFFKIFLYNPFYTKKASDLLLNGAILGQKLQPHEAHIPYILQFMIDYNIYGMGLVSFSKVKYRINPKKPESLEGINVEAVLPDRVKKGTCSHFEVDAFAADIVLKNNEGGLKTNPGLQAIWENEKIRRRQQNKSSQFTVEETQSNREQNIYPTEAMYKERLTEKLKEINNPVILVKSNEPRLSYPAEVTEGCNLLEASVLNDVTIHLRADLEDLSKQMDVSALIDEKILSQISEESQESIEKEIREGDGIDADSILGKNEIEGEEDEEEEPGKGDGGDMTQPLDIPEEVLSDLELKRARREQNSSDREDFWQSMAEKILQIDGAHDCSSDSDLELSNKSPSTNCNFEKEINSIQNCQNFTNESLTSILSVLNDSSLVSQTDSTSTIIPQSSVVWSSFPPRMDCTWLPQTQEAWTWEKNEFPLSDCFSSKGQAFSICDFPLAVINKPLEVLNSNESLENLLTSNQLDNYTSVSTSPASNLESNYSDSSPLAILTPSREVNSYSDITVSPISECTEEVNKSSESKENRDQLSNPKAEKKIFLESTNRENEKFERKKKGIKRKLRESFEIHDENSTEICSNKPISLTLKQYLKDFGEIVNIDLENLNGQDMVVIEYKPFNLNTSQSKFVIKPLEKFLENWNVAEKKINNELIKKSKTPRDGETAVMELSPSKDFQNLSNKSLLLKHSDLNQKNNQSKASKLKIFSDKIMTKSAKVLPILNEVSESCNKKGHNEKKENYDSAKRKKPNVKAIKSQKNERGKNRVKDFNELEESLTMKNGIKNEDHDFYSRYKNYKINKLSKVVKSFDKKPVKFIENDSKTGDVIISKLRATKNRKNKKESVEKKKILETAVKKEPKVDSKLINQINSCFEDYYQNILKVNKLCQENKNNVYAYESNKNSDFSDSEEKRFNSSDDDENSNSSESFSSKTNTESVEFVAKLLSTVSKMSQSGEIPPLSITINIGNNGTGSCSESVPVLLNFQKPNNTKSVDKVKCKEKKLKRKFKIQNVDGPADSSSEESLESPIESCEIPSRKKSKRDYKALNVFLQKFDRKKDVMPKKKSLITTKSLEDNKTTSVGRDSFTLCRKNKLKSQNDSIIKSTSSNKFNLLEESFKYSKSKSVENKEGYLLSKSVLNITLKDEPDIIYESDHEVTTKISFLKKKKKKTCKNKMKKDILKDMASSNLRKDSTNDNEQRAIIKNRCTPETESKSTYEIESKLLVENMLNKIINMDDTQARHDLKNENHLVVSKKKSINSKDKIDASPLEFCEKENSTDSAKSLSDSLSEKIATGMPLSGSPLCSPHETSLSSSDTIKDDSCLSAAPWFTDPNANIDVPSTSKTVFFPLDLDNELKSDLSNSSSSTLVEDKFFQPSKKKHDDKFDIDDSFDIHAMSCDSNDEVSFSVISLNAPKNVVPKMKPPSWKEVRSYIFLHENFKEFSKVPFWGDARDVTKAMESGPLVLKVETHAFGGLKEYKTDLDILGAEERRAQSLNLRDLEKDKIRYLLVPDRNITITPLNNPPYSSALTKFINFKSEAKEKEETNRSKMRVILPLSPGQESLSENELDLSMTPSALKNSQEKHSAESPLQSGESSKSLVKSSASSDSNELFNPKTHFEKVKSKKKLFEGKLKTIPEKLSPCSASKEPNADLMLMLKRTKSAEDNSFQIRGVTLENTFGFNNSVENLQNVASSHTYQYLTLMVVEIHVQTRKDFLPDPQYDPIRALFYTITFDSPVKNQETGVIVVGNIELTKSAASVKTVHRVNEEKHLLIKLVDLINIWDPDILAGYEIEMQSWGYIIQRSCVLDFNLLSLLGRVLNDNLFFTKISNEDFENTSRGLRDLKVSGRIVLDIWRVLRHEVTLSSYTFENVIYHLSHERHPLISYKTLSFYWEHPSQKFRHITVDYYLTRVIGIVKILNQLDFINRISEFARLFGIQFYEVLSRGSQFRVESMMLRLAKPLNYVPASPSVSQRASMRAPASLPLILEPESVFYSDPVIVLDFQSLYPSMIIAYNYCFSTCLGRIEKLGGFEPFEFGCTQLQVSPQELKALENDITISPAGVAFVKNNIRKGILPLMLEEILETRLLVKKSMKENKNNKLLQKILHAQQLGLKLIANVTYGYTAANFSGRMPSVEVGDSVVSKGRETLHRAIQMVKKNNSWNARVVYGDTDSIFVLTPGRSREEAFQIGSEIAKAVTQDNPRPVKLKLEKIYQPCILQTKKRYVGYMYESPDQEEPIFEAKGIETVRRDGCSAVRKILEKSLRILFDTRDVSLVKKYAIRQFSKLFQGHSNIQDLIFAKEYRGKNGYRPGACVPALQLTREWTSVDKRAEPRVKERVPYVIVNGPPGVPLIKLVRSPKDLQSDPSLRINAVYYITKAIIPPLHRCFSLIGVDVTSWYTEMPKKIKKGYMSNVTEDQKKSTISQYFSTVECVICSEITNYPVCQECRKRPQVLTVNLIDKIRHWEKLHSDILKICQSCCNSITEIDCQSLDCPVLFRRIQTTKDLQQVSMLYELLLNDQI